MVSATAVRAALVSLTIALPPLTPFMTAELIGQEPTKGAKVDAKTKVDLVAAQKAGRELSAADFLDGKGSPKDMLLATLYGKETDAVHTSWAKLAEARANKDPKAADFQEERRVAVKDWSEKIGDKAVDGFEKRLKAGKGIDKQAAVELLDIVGAYLDAHDRFGDNKPPQNKSEEYADFYGANSRRWVAVRIERALEAHVERPRATERALKLP